MRTARRAVAALRVARLLGQSVATLGRAPLRRPTAPDDDAQTADQILDRVAQTYAQCGSYSDTGTVTVVYHYSSWIMRAHTIVHGRHVTKVVFKTAFIRPTRFRFEFYELHERKGIVTRLREISSTPDTYNPDKSRYITWREREATKSWWGLEPAIVREGDFGMAVAAATGVSNGSAHTVPALLLPEVGGRLLTDIADSRRIKDARIGDTICYRIQGKSANDPITIWIEKRSFLIRRIDEQGDLKGAENTHYTETTTYDPQVNGKVADAALVFDPSNQN